ncbi:hypothetical protein [Actinokineospora terrae]|uniref:Uncharacterized protein n=1 Tax=Actinokineospora terrae TaxID=155974 RepID=A0A1H9V6J9_9PSEU|nr:hypothetical protein [Actinokineospora terrae]SES17386.1 hypothetical protein SAMN04487818_108100 [Actinokineospora terrae]
MSTTPSPGEPAAEPVRDQAPPAAVPEPEPARVEGPPAEVVVDSRRTVSLLVAGLAGAVLLLVGGIVGYAIGNSGDRPGRHGGPGHSWQVGPGRHGGPGVDRPGQPGFPPERGRRPNTPPAPSPSSVLPTPNPTPAPTPSS